MPNLAAPACNSRRVRLLSASLFWAVVGSFIFLYGECMARMISTTVRLNADDVRALKRARAAGHSDSEVVRKGLGVVASRTTLVADRP
jgi:hypothetical protein